MKPWASYVRWLTGDLDGAIADFTRALSLNPVYTRAYTNRGIAYMAKGSFDCAINDFNKALALDPHDATALEKRNLAIAGTRTAR